GTVCVVGKIRDLILQLSKSSIYSTKPMSGSSDIGLNDVMLAMQKSSISFSFGVQARNKMLSAYQEIMNTPV
uniref:flagellar hook-basal body complex protein FliE n=1 Tax=Enterobacter hormaechei TaxID=158836 RepID=UPI002022FEA0